MTPTSLGPVSWIRTDGDSHEARIEVEVFPDDTGARIEWRTAGHEGTADLTGEPAERPAVLLLHEPVEQFDQELEALRLPSGTADVVTDAVALFQSR
ncbi:hypothetical protein [Halorarum salinum]|uniref:Uncharacterized protein n=1 Tax=Halorarum salinum TaxID=2743089 RepID=A0A7D5QHL6_9EURY|nr:hypothetical protein [Halobaculum salinum]QLG62842.1 hypothetical protein HUG12_14335 [Halobaculum salinum]